MTPPVLAIAQCHHETISKHLLAKDGLEAAAILLCGRTGKNRVRYVVQDFELVPHSDCMSRTQGTITWPGALLARAQERAEDNDLSIILVHSHPGGLFQFSATDDVSDTATMSAVVDGWTGAAPCPPHGSAIMVPGGGMRARMYSDGKPVDCAWVETVGDDIRRWHYNGTGQWTTPMAFGDEMQAELSVNHAAIVGVSGTGSIVAEQVARLGFGSITLIDFDRVEHKNLNRILNSTHTDAEALRLKVDLFADAIRSYRPLTRVESIAQTVMSREAIGAIAECDVLFSCVDSAEGRQICDFAAQAFILPLIDMGVTIPTRTLRGGGKAIAEVLGRVDYVKPGGSWLSSRGVYGPDSLRAEYLARSAPEDLEAERDEGYIRGAPAEAPAVLPLNMRAASSAVMEYLARAFPFRHDPNGKFARTLFRIAEGEEEYFGEDAFEAEESYLLGAGWTEPPLGIPALSSLC